MSARKYTDAEIDSIVAENTKLKEKIASIEQFIQHGDNFHDPLGEGCQIAEEFKTRMSVEPT